MAGRRRGAALRIEQMTLVSDAEPYDVPAIVMDRSSTSQDRRLTIRRGVSRQPQRCFSAISGWRSYQPGRRLSKHRSGAGHRTDTCRYVVHGAESGLVLSFPPCRDPAAGAMTWQSPTTLTLMTRHAAHALLLDKVALAIHPGQGGAHGRAGGGGIGLRGPPVVPRAGGGRACRAGNDPPPR
jgi:hypothetical protein